METILRVPTDSRINGEHQFTHFEITGRAVHMEEHAQNFDDRALMFFV